MAAFASGVKPSTMAWYSPVSSRSRVRTASAIAAFAVDAASGRLTLIDHTPTETQPRGMGIDPSGRWLVAAGQLSSRLTVYAIDAASGRLRAVHSHATGADPICVEIVALPDA